MRFDFVVLRFDYVVIKFDHAVRKNSILPRHRMDGHGELPTVTEFVVVALWGP